MPLTDSERARVRSHLGYMNVRMASSLSFGIPRPIETLFLVENAMNLLMEPDGVDRVRRLLGILDQMECLLLEAAPNLQISEVDGVKINPMAPAQIEREYVRWSNRLADELGVPHYSFSQRFRGVPPGGAGNVPVA